jgi:hypothetical protein
VVAVATLEMVATHPMIVLEMADHGLDVGTTAHLAADSLRSSSTVLLSRRMSRIMRRSRVTLDLFSFHRARLNWAV